MGVLFSVPLDVHIFASTCTKMYSFTPTGDEVNIMHWSKGSGIFLLSLAI